MDYEATDRYMSSWVVTCVRLGTRYYLADNDAETATDIWKLARIYRYRDLAEETAERVNQEPGFAFGWTVKSVPSAMCDRYKPADEDWIPSRLDP